MSLAPAITVLLVTGDQEVLPALLASIEGNRRDDVEWLVVDNGVQPIEHPADLGGTPVRWLGSPPRDGHLAFARGAAAALGSYIFPILPGDLIESGSLPLLIREWQAVPSLQRSRFSGLTGLVETGAPRGTPGAMSPFPLKDAEPVELRYHADWTGQPAFAVRVELARAIDLPSPGGPLPPLDTIWITASRGLATRTLNETLIRRNGPAAPSLESERYDALEALSHDLSRLVRSPSRLLETTRRYHQTSRDLQRSYRSEYRDLSGNSRLIWLATLPFSRKRPEPPELPPDAGESFDPFSEAARVPPAALGRGRLVLLARSLPVDGAERQLISLAIGLHRRHVDLRVVVFYRGPLERELIEAGVPLTILEKRGRWDVAGFLPQLARTLRELHPAVVLSYPGSPNVASALLRSVHRARIAWRVQPSGFGSSVANRSLERSLARFAAVLIAGSQIERAMAAAEGYPASRLIAIPNGVDTEHFRRDEGGRITTRNAWRIPEGAPLIGRVGRLEAHKDYPSFLQAAAIVARARTDVRFVCIGGGASDQTNDLRRLGEQLGLGERIIWTGAITMQASTYSALDLLVSSSSSGEGVPMVVAEAMACGVPVAATDVGDSAWTVGDERFIVPPSNPGALAEAMLALLRDIDDRLIDQGALRARIERDLSIDRMLDRTLAALFGSGER